MSRNFSGMGLTVAGAALAVFGVYAMWWGWEIILNERGWSVFIAGSVFLTGGVVTVALGRIVAHLARLGVAAPIDETHGDVVEEVVARPQSPPPQQEAAAARPPAPPPARPEPIKPPEEPFDRPDFAALLGGEPLVEEPTEVDRYSAGDATYIMMSDGSVEVRSAAGSQRYPSLAALKAEAESRQR